MVKRQFSKEERAIALKSKGRIEEEIEHLKWLVEYNELMLIRGYHMNYLEKMRAGKKNKKELMGELQSEGEKLKVLEEQLKSGVEIMKKKVNGDKVGERGYTG